MLAAVLRPLDYQVFSFKGWQPNDSWCSLDNADQESASLARQYFWDLAEKQIQKELQRYARAGWEPTELVDPRSIRLRKSTTVETNLQLDDVFLGIITCGISLIQQLLMNTPRCYTTYYPVELNIRLRRISTDEAGYETAHIAA